MSVDVQLIRTNADPEKCFCDLNEEEFLPIDWNDFSAKFLEAFPSAKPYAEDSDELLEMEGEEFHAFLRPGNEEEGGGVNLEIHFKSRSTREIRQFVDRICSVMECRAVVDGEFWSDDADSGEEENYRTEPKQTPAIPKKKTAMTGWRVFLQK